MTRFSRHMSYFCNFFTSTNFCRRKSVRAGECFQLKCFKSQTYCIPLHLFLQDSLGLVLSPYQMVSPNCCFFYSLPTPSHYLSLLGTTFFLYHSDPGVPIACWCYEAHSNAPTLIFFFPLSTIL